MCTQMRTTTYFWQWSTPDCYRKEGMPPRTACRTSVPLAQAGPYRANSGIGSRQAPDSDLDQEMPDHFWAEDVTFAFSLPHWSFSPTRTLVGRLIYPIGAMC